jgi:hypothetical protein
MGVSLMLGPTGETTVPRQTLSLLDSTDVKVLSTPVHFQFINTLTYFEPIWSAAACCRFHSAKLASRAFPSAQQAPPTQSASKLAHSKYARIFME